MSSKTNMILRRIEIIDLDIKNDSHHYKPHHSELPREALIWGYADADDGLRLISLSRLILERSLNSDEYHGTVKYRLPEFRIEVESAEIRLIPHFIYSFLHMSIISLSNEQLHKIQGSCYNISTLQDDTTPATLSFSLQENFPCQQVLIHGKKVLSLQVTRPHFVVKFGNEVFQGLGIDFGENETRGYSGALITTDERSKQAAGILILRYSDKNILFGISVRSLLVPQSKSKVFSLSLRNSWYSWLKKLQFTHQFSPLQELIAEIEESSTEKETDDDYFTDEPDEGIDLQYIEDSAAPKEQAIVMDAKMKLDEGITAGKPSERITTKEHSFQKQLLSLRSRKFVVGKEGGLFCLKSLGLCLYVPPDALETAVPMYLGISKNSDDLPKRRGKRCIDNMLSPVIVCGPHGVKFKLKATLFFQHSLLLDDKTERRNIRMYRSNTSLVEDVSWEAMASTVPRMSRRWCSVDIEGFSKYYMGSIGDAPKRILQVLVYCDTAYPGAASFRVYVIDSEDWEETEVMNMESRRNGVLLARRNFLYDETGETGIKIELHSTSETLTNQGANKEEIPHEELQQTRVQPINRVMQQQSDSASGQLKITVSQPKGDSKSILIHILPAPALPSPVAEQSQDQNQSQNGFSQVSAAATQPSVDTSQDASFAVEDNSNLESSNDECEGAVGGMATNTVEARCDTVESPGCRLEQQVLERSPNTPVEECNIPLEVIDKLQEELYNNSRFRYDFAATFCNITETMTDSHRAPNLIHLFFIYIAYDRQARSNLHDFFRRRRHLFQSEGGRYIFHYFVQNDPEMLSREAKAILEKNMKHLSQHLNTSAVMEELLEEEVVTFEQYMDIVDKPNERERNRKLLVIVHEGTRQNMLKLRRILQSNGQAELLRFLPE